MRQTTKGAFVVSGTLVHDGESERARLDDAPHGTLVRCQHHPKAKPALAIEWVSPENAEAHTVTRAVARKAMLRAIGGERLDDAAMDWERLFSSASPPGAPSPTVAKASLTRQAMRQKEARRRAFRSGISGLVAAIRVA